MVKPIGPSHQPAPVKPDVEQPGVDAGKEQPVRTNKPVPTYSEKAQISRRAEHSFAGQAQAMKLMAELERTQGKSNPKNSNASPLATAYPNIANANQKKESK
jgi:hypothetical protein